MALALSNVLGGVIGEFSFRYTIYASFPFFLAAVPLSILLREPERKRKDVEDGHRKELLAIAMKIVTHKRLGGIIFYSGVIFAFNQSVLWLYQPYFKLSGMDVLYFGAVFALFQVTAAFSSKYAHSLEAWLGEKRSLILLTIVTGSSYLLMGSFVFAFSFLFCLLQQFVRGYKSTVITDYINRIAPPESRATVLSAESLIGRLVYALIVPVFGYFADTYTLARTLIIMGATTLAAGGFILAFLRKNRVI